MKNRRRIGFVLAGLLPIMAVASETARGQTAGSSPLAPASAGVTLTGIIECGQGYTSHELYDMKITLLEVVRGEGAWKRLQEGGASNKPAGAGFEYILARVRFEYFARGTPGLCIHKLSVQQFTAFSSDGEEYKASSVVPPKPEIAGSLHSGESAEGWVAFLVSLQDKKPLMTYSADVGGAILHGGGKWFQLY